MREGGGEGAGGWEEGAASHGRWRALYQDKWEGLSKGWVAKTSKDNLLWQYGCWVHHHHHHHFDHTSSSSCQNAPEHTSIAQNPALRNAQ